MITESFNVASAVKTSMRYGCVFCRIGSERAVVESLEAQNPGLIASYVSKIKHKSMQGKKSTEAQILLPGYVYFQTKEVDPPYLLCVRDAIRLVRPSIGHWALWGLDAWFAHWLFENHGVIGLSKASMVDGRIRMISGPLKELEGYVVKIDKRSRGGQVALPFHDREVRMWLAFEVEEINQ